jgi:hypothetical protein
MWDNDFLALFERCRQLHAAGNHDFASYYHDKDRAFLRSIGCQEREFYDFVEDANDFHEPSASNALLIAAVRRDYFLTVQKGEASNKRLTPAELPTFGDTIADIAYLPRILAKARAKLRGELDPDVMFGCGGDRNFLRQQGDKHLADFLRHVWAAGDNDEKIVAYLLSR